MEIRLNTLGIAHDAIARHVSPGDFCIDATAGNGNDTAFLCELVGETGRVLALDIQQQAVERTRALLESKGLAPIATVVRDSHSNLLRYAQPGTVSCVVFNFGYLPGGDHSLYTRPQTSIPAVRQGLTLLKPGGLMCLCIYYGGDTGYEERDALLSYLKEIDSKVFTVVLSQFYNRPNDPPMAAYVIKGV